jgi:eukaryotic-like serine/threonine-protein kinase
MVGKVLSHYEILAQLGAGGMGVVYKARDTRLNRFVAIKVLPADKLGDAERRRRFIQEAQAASALNHPNILTIHEISSENGTDFMVMEYVQGKTLDALIPRKGMRLNEMLKLAIQMAEALSKAHAAGIVHRDLKPGNVMVTEDGLVKVLDFGLAKLTEVSDSADAATATLQAQTDEGTIVGTVSYMSPEQAEGKKVDGRSDIFSLGAVLYEIATGQRAFQGESKMSTLAAILREEPRPASQLVAGIPRDLEKVINRCLRKDANRRFQHMADLKVTLEELKEESDSGALTGVVPAPRPTPRIWLWAGAAMVVVALGVAGWFFHERTRNPTPAPEVVPLTSYAGIEQSPSFSLDGNQVAFSWNGEKQDNFDIYVKLIGSPTPLRLTKDSADDLSPAFSPDGRSIGFIRLLKEHPTLIIVPALGGPERVVAEVTANTMNLPFTGQSFAWHPKGTWVVTDGLTLLSAETGETRKLTSPPTKFSVDFSPAVSPDGRMVAFSRSTGYSSSEIYQLEITDDLKPKGEPKRLTELKNFSVASAWTPDGKAIVFSSGLFGIGTLWKVAVSGNGQPEQLPFGTDNAYWPSVSRNGNRLAYQRVGFDSDIWRVSLSSPGTAAAPPARFVTSTRLDENPEYSPDGKRIAFESERSGVHEIWICDADGSNAVELFPQVEKGAGSARWSPDGQRITFDYNGEGTYSIYGIRANGGKPVRLTTGTMDNFSPSWSRDGKWVYFASKRTGRYEIWKMPAAGGEPVQVTQNGGETAFESPDGKSIYYVKAYGRSSLWEMPASGGEERQVLPSVINRAFCLVQNGIYFIPESGSGQKPSIGFLSLATGKVKIVASLSGLPREGLSVSPDGRSVLFSQEEQAGSDLMLVENFR